jgi:predicted esterase
MRGSPASVWTLAPALAVLLGCGESASTQPPALSRPLPPPLEAPTEAASGRPAVRDDGLVPLEGEPTIDLPLSWGEPAFVSLPLGATSPQPVLVATHGAGGRPEYHCGLWRQIAGGTGFIVCPRGFPMNRSDPHTGYFYDGHPALGREIEAALSALSERFGAHVAADRPIFSGYSQGASMGALVLPRHSARFARAVLWEGGVGQYQEWNVAVAERFRDNGAERVLMACGQPKCQAAARTTAGYFERAGLEVRLVYVPGAGHTAGGRLAEEVAGAFGWLVAGDPRW